MSNNISKLESDLLSTKDMDEKANIIIELLREYKKTNNTDGVRHLDQLDEFSASLQNNTYKAFAAFYRGDSHWSKGNFDEAKKCFINATHLFEKANRPDRLAYTYNSLGIISEQQGNFIDSVDYYNKAKSIFTEIDDKNGLAMCYNNLGILQKYQGNYPEAINNYFESLKIHDTLLNLSNAGMALVNIANVFYLQEKHDDYLKYSHEALTKFELAKDKKGISLALNNIATHEIEKKQYDSALEMLYKSILIAKEIDAKVNIALASAQIGYVFILQEKFDNALIHLNEALDIYRELDYKSFIVEELCLMATCYRHLSEHDKASNYLVEAYQLADTDDLKSKLQEVYREMYMNEKAMGDYQKSLASYEKYILIQKEIENEETSKKIASMQFGYQIEKKEQEVTFEREKKEEIQKAYGLLDIEKQRSESLLLNILPAEVAEELKEKGTAEAKHFKNVTVLFTDFKGFTTVSENMTPQELVNEIHECFKGFDEIIDKYQIEKIKTVGDAYIAVSGLPIANKNHATDIIKAAIEIRDFMLKRREEKQEKTFELRIGINSGEVVAGIVGMKKYAYDIWGDTVNIAARMEQNCEAGKINISSSTYTLVNTHFDCKHRGKIAAKNKGEIDMYYIVGIKN
jgi:adenylate cyclase